MGLRRRVGALIAAVTVLSGAVAAAQAPGAGAAARPQHESVTPADQAAEGAAVLAFEREVAAALVRGDVAMTYGRYVGYIPSSPPGRRWFYVWYEKVYAKRGGRWVYLSHRTVDGAHYGDDRRSVSLAR